MNRAFRRAGFLFLALLGPAWAQAGPDRPNILILMAEDMGARSLDRRIRAYADTQAGQAEDHDFHEGIAAAIVDWLDADSEPGFPGGAEATGAVLPASAAASARAAWDAAECICQPW